MRGPNPDLKNSPSRGHLSQSNRESRRGLWSSAGERNEGKQQGSGQVPTHGANNTESAACELFGATIRSYSR
jgi:hypothetical protein